MKRLILSCVIIGALAIPTAAPAKIHKLSGPVEGDANATVSMKVKVNRKNKPKKVFDFAWAGLDGFCDGAPAGEQSGTAASLFDGLAALNSFRVFGPYDQAVGDGDVVDISGMVRQRGKKVVGGLVAVSFNDGFCSAPPLDRRSFTATKQ